MPGRIPNGKSACRSWRKRTSTSSPSTCRIPLRIRPGRDRLPQVAPVEVRVLARDLERLVPQHRVHAELRLPVELDEARGAPGVHEPEGVDAEALHHPEAAGNRPIRHDPHDHVHRLGHQRDEVPERVVGGGGLGDLVVRLRLHRVDQVGELHRVLDEEDGDVVADQIEVALVGVELHREAAHVARQIGRPPRARHRGEAHEDRRLLCRVLQERGTGVAASDR